MKSSYLRQNPSRPIDTLFQSYDRNLYKITGTEQQDSIMDMIDSNNPGATQGDSLTIDASNIGSGVSTSTIQTASGSHQQGKKLFTDTVQGYILGVDPKDGLAKFAIGNATSFFQWDGTTVTTTGTIVATGFTTVDSGGNTVVQINTSGFSTTFAIAITTTAAVPSGVSVVSAQAGVGFYYSNAANVASRGIYVENTSTGANNIQATIETRNSSNVSGGTNFAMYAVGANAAGGILIQVAGTGTLLSFLNSGTGSSIAINDSATTGTNPCLSISYARAGAGIDIAVSHSGGNPTGIKINTSNGAGNSYAFEFAGGEVVSAAVGGTQNRKIRVLLPTGAVYYIPCYDA